MNRSFQENQPWQDSWALRLLQAILMRGLGWKRKAGRGETTKLAIRFGVSHDVILF